MAALLLALAVLAAHGWSLDDGLALDDHWHYRTVRAAEWSVHDLFDATTIDVRQLADFWWQIESVRFEYARPVAVAAMKAVYAATGDSVFAQHVFSLVLHFVATMLVFRLCRMLTGRFGWSVVGGVVFAVYPHSVFAAGWLAAQNAPLHVVLMLASLFLYVRASGLDLHRATGAPPAVRPAALMGAALCWLAAIFSRENAVMLPAIFVAFDLAFGGRLHLRARWPIHAAMLAAAAAFVVFRITQFDPMPDVYSRKPGVDGFWLWCVAKLLHYLCCAVWVAPMAIGPTGRYHPFSEALADCVVMLAIVAFLATAYYLVARKARGWWIWPLWILLAVAPVVPVMATPHSGYLCGVGVAVGLTLCAVYAERRRRLIHVAVIVMLVGYSAFDKSCRLLWRGMIYAERFTSDAMAADPPPQEVTDVFLINLPFAAIYARDYMTELWDPRAAELNWHVITFAPELERMNERCIFEQIDERSFTLEAPHTGYFSGLLGRFLVDGFRAGGQFEVGERINAGEFDVTVVEVDDQGVHKLLFTFQRPLDDERYCFYLTSYACGALRLRFDSPGRLAAMTKVAPADDSLDHAEQRILSGDASAAQSLFAALRSDDAAVRDAAAEALRRTAGIVAEALAAPVQHCFDPGSDLAACAIELETWWVDSVRNAYLRQIFRDRERLSDLRHRRDEIDRHRAFVRRFLKLDLYLSGEPFPGPK